MVMSQWGLGQYQETYQVTHRRQTYTVNKYQNQN